MIYLYGVSFLLSVSIYTSMLRIRLFKTFGQHFDSLLYVETTDHFRNSKYEFTFSCAFLAKEKKVSQKDVFANYYIPEYQYFGIYGFMIDGYATEARR